jgi:hypothetical protein
MKLAIVFLGLVTAMSGTGSARQTPMVRKVACKTPENAKACYWTHGRLSLYNGGRPNLRLWKIGTRRLLGMFSGPGALGNGDYEEDGVELPAEISNHDFTKSPVFGYFEVCPLAAEREGAMQPACIESEQERDPRKR